YGVVVGALGGSCDVLGSLGGVSGAGPPVVGAGAGVVVAVAPGGTRSGLVVVAVVVSVVVAVAGAPLAAFACNSAMRPRAASVCWLSGKSRTKPCSDSTVSVSLAAS